MDKYRIIKYAFILNLYHVTGLKHYFKNETLVNNKRDKNRNNKTILDQKQRIIASLIQLAIRLLSIPTRSVFIEQF